MKHKEPRLSEEEKDAEYIRLNSLINTLAYHCKHCNYVWLPRDYDYEHDNIIRMKAPKSCARCKSKQWNQERINGRMFAPKALIKAGFRRNKASGKISKAYIEQLESIPPKQG